MTNDNLKAALTAVDQVFFHLPAAVEAAQKVDALYETGSLVTGADVSFILGPTRSGKTCLLENIVRMPKYAATRTELADILPIVSVHAPFQASRKAMGENLLQALGHPGGRGAGRNLADIESMCVYFLRERKVRLVIVDEVQQLARSDAYLAADFFKGLANESKVPFLLCGLPDALNMAHENRQLRYRTRDVIELRPFEWDDVDSRANFESLMQSYDDLLKGFGVACADFAFTDPAIVKRTYWLSGGLVGVVSMFLRKCLTTAILAEAPGLTIPILAEAAALDAAALGANPFLVPTMPATPPAAKFDAGVNRAARRRRK